MVNIVVLGAGAVGISTAFCIQRELPGVKVTVVADKFSEDTTSNGAAGICAPLHLLVKTNTDEELGKYLKDSFAWYDAICRSEDGPEAGIQRISGYDIMLERRDLPKYRDIVYHFREMTESELRQFSTDVRYGWFYTTLMVECVRYLPWLMRRFKENGGNFVTKHINTLDDVPGDYDVIVNCLGLGSKTVFRDNEMYPARGHVLRVKAPWIKHFLRAHNPESGETYIFPGQDNVVLGGTYQKNQYNTQDYQPEIFDEIVDRVSKYVPAMKHVPVERKWIGLRPCRSQLRIEREDGRVHGRSVHVVHNYGHGHQGILLSWGTAVRTTQIVRQCISRPGTAHNTKSKL